MPKDQPTEKQLKAILHKGSHSRVIAGPGTGKSRVIIGHITQSIIKEGIDPKSILVLAFNRSIAEKLKIDLSKPEYLGTDEAKFPVIMTIHSYALRLLKRFRISSEIGHATFPSSKEMPLVIRVIARFLNNKGVVYKGKKITTLTIRKKLYPLYEKRYHYGVKKVTKEDQGILQHISDAVIFVKRFFGVRFLNELPSELRKLISQEPESRKFYKKIIVDEYQDLNPEDILLIKALCTDDTEVMVAGDDDQSICSYRGADSKGLEDFEKEYANVITHPLDICFRCPQAIFKLGQEIISQTPPEERIQKSVKCTNSLNGYIANWRFKTTKSQNENLIEVIKKYSEQTKDNPKAKVLVIVTKSDFVNVYLKELRAAGLQVEDLSLVGTDENLYKFWLVLRAMVNPADQLALNGILERKEKKWDTIFSNLLNIIDWNQYQNTLFGALHQHRVEIESSSTTETKNSLNRIYLIIKEIQDYQSKKILKGSNIKDELTEVSRVTGEIFPEYDPITVLRAIEEISNNIVKENIPINEPFDILAHFLPLIEEKAKSDPSIKIGVTTLSKAKGLEDDLVIIPDLEDHILPGKKDPLEARRLLYVAVTRAKKCLILSSVITRVGVGGWAGGDSSIFKKPSSLIPISLRTEDGEVQSQKILSDISILTEIK